MIKKLIALLIFNGIVIFCSAQKKISFGPQFGISRKPSGAQIHAELDSVIVDGNNTTKGDHSFGAFFNYELTQLFSARVELNYFHSSTPYRIYNQYRNDFTGYPTVKVSVIGHSRIEVPIFLRLTLPFAIPKTKIGVEGGLNTQFLFHSSEDPVVIPNYLQETLVIHALHYAPRPVMAIPTYGVFVLLFDRAEVSAKYTRVTDYIRDVDYNGKRYRINSLAEYLFITVGYRLYSFKSGNALKKKE